MATLGCLWNRPRLERLVDGALDPRMGRATSQHVSHCQMCGSEVERLRRLRLLVKSTRVEVADPDWAPFWPAVHARIVRDRPQAMRDSWWFPIWKPVWGHPRMAFGGALAAGLAAAVMLWPAPAAFTTASVSPVVVQDVSTADPDHSVMVYSNPDDEMTVIWVFNPSEQDEQS